MLARTLAPVISVACTLWCASGVRAATDDAYLAGYAAAAIESGLGLEVVSVEVKNGVALVVLQDLNGETPDRVVAALSRIDGIDHVEVRVAGAGEEPLAEAEPDDENDRLGIDVLPRDELFRPLLADPRQPHFSASYQWYLDQQDATHVGSANLGETFALLGGKLRDDGPARWELGVMAGVFSLFDMDANSYDLVNSDYTVAGTFSLRSNGLSSLLRIYHQSSHLGDEYLMRGTTVRESLSYEGVNLLISTNLHPTLRIYAGAGEIINSTPDLHPLSAQGGFEARSPVAFLGDRVRPLVAGDFQFREENHWHEEIAAVAGIEIANPEGSRLRFQILCEYFRGNTRTGQFFNNRIESLGLGLHLHF